VRNQETVDPTIRDAYARLTHAWLLDEGEDESEEGRLVYRQHRVRERDQSLGKKKKKKNAALRKTGRLACEVCDFEFTTKYGDLGEGFIEAHNVVPLSTSVGTRTTRLSDLALVCSNCRRMLHRGKPSLRPAELRRRLDPAVRSPEGNSLGTIEEDERQR
jgi:5-methylcytosine-specific restriction protein A